MPPRPDDCQIRARPMAQPTGLLSICYRDEAGALRASTRLCRVPPAAAEYRYHGDRRRHRRDMARQTRWLFGTSKIRGPNFASCEYFRRQAGVPLQNYCVAVDFGQSVDNSVVQRVILRVYKKGSNDQYLHNFDVLPSSDMLVFWYLLFGI